MTEGLKRIMPILYSKPSFAGLEFHYVISGGFLFLGYFLFFPHFDKICIIRSSQHFDGVFPLNPAHEMNKGAGSAL